MFIEKYDPLKNTMLQILDENGIADKNLIPDLDEKKLIQMYKYMIISRIADEKSFTLQREGRMGTYAPLKGQEATQVGSVYALGKEDWLFPLYRDLGAMFVKGVPLNLLFLFWMGNEEGCKFPEGTRVFPISVPVGSQISISVGFSWAAKIQKENIVTMVSFGDGATSEGDFHDGMNFAGVFKTPVVFLCQNNQYAISVPVTRQTASRTLAQKAIAYGFHGIRVDGNDVLAVYAAAKEAVEKARSGEGPTLIESCTYRIGDHTTADDASRYRSDSELNEWIKKDPITRFRIYLTSIGLLNEELEKEINREADELVKEAVKKAEETPAPEPEEIFKYTYEKMPPHLNEQLEELKESLTVMPTRKTKRTDVGAI